MPHTADVRLEAWAPSREACVVEAARALVAAFADPGGTPPATTVDATIERGNDEDLLVDVLNEVIYLTETTGRVPVDTEVVGAGDGLTVRFHLVDADRVTPVGAVPKAVALHDLRFERVAGGWTCAVTLDV